jgi:hypothetical protein
MEPVNTYGNKDKFIELDKAIRGDVTFADHSKVVIKGKCTILIKLKDKSHQFIGDVYYTLKVKSNILSLGQLLEKGYEIKMKDRTLTLLETKGDMITKVVMTKNKIFLLNIEMDVPKCLNDGEKYDLLPILDEEEEIYEDHQELIVTPPQTPTSSTSSFSSSDSSNSTPTRKVRSLDDLYEVINPFDNDGIQKTPIILRQDIVKRKKR